MKVKIELTDTYGGEANYNWVERKAINHEGSDRSLIRKAKRLLGVTARHTKEDMGDLIILRFPEKCFIMFIEFCYE